MGVILKQSIRSTFSYYFGMIIGAVNTIVLYPLIFNNNPDQLGLIQILLAYSIIFSTLSNLSLPSIIIKFFPTIRNKGQLLLFTIITSIIGFSIFLLIFIFFFNDFLNQNENTLFIEYSYYIIFLVFFISFSDVLGSFSRSYLDSSTPIFLNEVFLKLYSITALILFWKEFINFDLFIHVYFIGYLIRFLILLIIQIYNNHLIFECSMSELRIGKIINFGSFVILGSTSALLISKIDMLMVASYIDLENVAYYTIAFYIGNAIMIPFRSINSISTPLLAEAFSNNNLDFIKNLYVKSSLNQLILGGVFFLCIWVNIDSIMFVLHQLSPKFSEGKYVVLFIAFSRLVALISGVNTAIIINSKYYKFDLLFNIPFLLFIVISNHILIPLYGINGAAFATFLSSFLFFTIKILFVYKKFNMHPFRFNTLKVFLLFIFLYLIVLNLNININIYIDIVIKSLIIITFSLVMIFKLNLSDDISNLFSKFVQRIRISLLKK
jgi:O-antigen/teichoic acid export membrane protein